MTKNYPPNPLIERLGDLFTTPETDIPKPQNNLRKPLQSPKTALQDPLQTSKPAPKPVLRPLRRAAEPQKHLVVSSEFGAFVGLVTLVEGRAVAMTHVRKADPEPSDDELLAAMRGAPLVLDGPEIQCLIILDAVLVAPYPQ